MPTKDYVCRLCLGTGKGPSICEDERCDHKNEACGDCPLCVGRGRPPVITGQTGEDLIIEVIPGKRLAP